MVGQCPECGADAVILNVGSTHWAVCEEHEVKWPVGLNLFSSWRYEDEAIWEANEEKLRRFEKVEPVHTPEDYSDERISEIVSSWEQDEMPPA